MCHKSVPEAYQECRFATVLYSCRVPLAGAQNVYVLCKILMEICKLQHWSSGGSNLYGCLNIFCQETNQSQSQKSGYPNCLFSVKNP